MTDEDISLLEADIAGTLGANEAVRVQRHAVAHKKAEIPGGLEKLVEDVQQEVMDLHIRSVWPPCPAHANHPLWFSGRAWRCPADATVFVALGSLASSSSHPQHKST